MSSISPEKWLSDDCESLPKKTPNELCAIVAFPDTEADNRPLTKKSTPLVDLHEITA
jgi:hypothetical protein